MGRDFEVSLRKAPSGQTFEEDYVLTSTLSVAYEALPYYWSCSGTTDQPESVSTSVVLLKQATVMDAGGSCFSENWLVTLDLSLGVKATP